MVFGLGLIFEVRDLSMNGTGLKRGDDKPAVMTSLHLLSILRDLVWLYQFCEILCGHMGAFDDEILTTCKAQSLETTQVGAKKDQAPSPCCNVNHKTRSPSFPTEKCLHCSNLAFSHCWILVVTLSSIVSPVISVPVKDLPLYHNTQILVRNSNCTTLPKWLWCSSSRMIN